jgi:NTE family protein
MAQLVEPVSNLAETKPRGISPGIGICLSGGGYRAMLFHLGAFLRLFELGLLQKASRISSVSGGSITSAKLGLEWSKLKTRDDFFSRVIEPIRSVAGTTIDKPAIVEGLILPGKVADYVAAAYRKMLFGAATLQDLPGKPEFVINATNVETGTLWRMSRPVMADYKVGEIDKPRLPLARAVAASSAFPPVLSPLVLRVKPSDFSRRFTKDEALLSDISLADGGVYDNLGLETVWKAYRNLLVSNAGAALQPNSSPSSGWISQAKRAIDIIYGQVGSLRQRQLIASFKAKQGDRGWRRGTYWAVGSDVSHYNFPGGLPAPLELTTELARLPTQLRPFGKALDERLINWGYAICDTAVRRHFGQANDPPAQFPYSGGV